MCAAAMVEAGGGCLGIDGVDVGCLIDCRFGVDIFGFMCIVR